MCREGTGKAPIGGAIGAKYNTAGSKEELPRRNSITHKSKFVKRCSMKLSKVQIGCIPDKDVDKLNDNPIRPITVMEILVDAAIFVAVMGAVWLMLIGLDQVMRAWGI